jgi:hypothetical protein
MSANEIAYVMATAHHVAMPALPIAELDAMLQCGQDLPHAPEEIPMYARRAAYATTLFTLARKNRSYRHADSDVRRRIMHRTYDRNKEYVDRHAAALALLVEPNHEFCRQHLEAVEQEDNCINVGQHKELVHGFRHAESDGQARTASETAVRMTIGRHPVHSRSGYPEAAFAAALELQMLRNPTPEQYQAATLKLKRAIQSRYSTPVAAST